MTATPLLTHETDVADVTSRVTGAVKITIDCGVMAMPDEKLDAMIKKAREADIRHIVLTNVCGQAHIATGIKGPARIDVYGIMGNHSAAFMDRVELNSYATTYPNGVWAPGDAQVAIGNTANPSMMNIGGSVDDLFAAYTPSGYYRVAGQGGNRCGLRGGAGIPGAWRSIDYGSLEGLLRAERKELMLHSYQKRKARIVAKGFDGFLNEFEKKVADREPPVIVFGRKVRDYFMEYAQGTVGVILNVFDIPYPAGYYICSGMTAGRGYIRGPISPDQLGERVTFAPLTDDDSRFLEKTVIDFYATFHDRMDDSYRKQLDWLRNEYVRDATAMTYQFRKIVPVS